jgi:hypothetical protein
MFGVVHAFARRKNAAQKQFSLTGVNLKKQVPVSFKQES